MLLSQVVNFDHSTRDMAGVSGADQIGNGQDGRVPEDSELVAFAGLLGVDHRLKLEDQLLGGHFGVSAGVGDEPDCGDRVHVMLSDQVT